MLGFPANGAIERFVGYAAAFDLEERATFAGARIRQLEDGYSAETATAIGDWLEAHAATLGIER